MRTTLLHTHRYIFTQPVSAIYFTVNTLRKHTFSQVIRFNTRRCFSKFLSLSLSFCYLYYFPLILMEFSFCKYFMFYGNKILESVGSCQIGRLIHAVNWSMHSNENRLNLLLASPFFLFKLLQYFPPRICIAIRVVATVKNYRLRSKNFSHFFPCSQRISLA